MDRVEAEGHGWFGVGGSPLHKVALTVPGGRAGHEIDVGVELDVRGTVKVSSARLVVRCSEHAMRRQGDYLDKRDHILSEQSYQVPIPGELKTPFNARVKVTVPGNATPAMPRTLVNSVRLELDLPWRPKLELVALLEVQPPGVPRLLEPAPSTLEADNELWATLNRPLIRPGEGVRGEVKIMPITKAQHARSLRVRLIALSHGWGDDRVEVYAETVLASGPFEVDRSIPFELALPTDAPLTYRGEIVDVDWFVEAELLETPGINPRSHTPFVVG